MYLLYLDESGDPYSWDHYNTFVLAGVAVFEGEINGMVASLDQIQKRFFPEIAVPLSFHASDIYTGKDRYRKWSPEQRAELMREVYKAMATARRPGLVPFVTAIDISWAGPGKDACVAALDDICRMFNGFLMRRFQYGSPSKGMLVVDPSGREPRYRDCVTNLRTNGSTWGYLGNVIDVPFFVHTKETRMMQLADFCAYAAFLHYERGNSEFFNMILPLFERRVDGGIYGPSYIRG